VAAAVVVVEATQIQINSLVIVQGYLDHANKLVVALGLVDHRGDPTNFEA